MASPISNSALVTVGKGIHLHSLARDGPPEHSHPTFILVFGWMGAKLPHLQKYTSVYREKYPNSPILLVQSEPSFFWATEYKRREALAPVVELLKATGYIPRPHTAPDDKVAEAGTRKRILVHAFSNGGCFQLTTLGKILSTNTNTSSTSPTLVDSAIIFDSCPGVTTFTSAQRAFASVITHPLARVLAKIFITFYFCLQLISKHLLRRKTAIQRMRYNLNKPDVLPWTRKDTPRLYIYSEGDKLVSSSAVERHIEEAKKGGLNIQKKKFGKESQHVAHARTDPKKYWEAVERLWEEASQLKTYT